jgi:plastocyanin
MYKKLLAASLLMFIGAGCTMSTTTSTTSGTTDTGTQAADTTATTGDNDGDADDGAGIVSDDEDTTADADTSAVTDDETGTDDEAADAAPSTKEFTVSGENFSFAPNTMSVKKGDTVKITFTNAEGFHDFRIDEYNVATAKLNAGASETVEFVADQTGTFEYYCSVGSHRAMGMKGTLTVE